MELINHNFSPLGVIFQEGFIITFKVSLQAATEGECLLSYCFLWAYILQVLVIPWMVQGDHSFEKKPRLGVQEPPLPAEDAHEVQTNSEPTVHFCKRHIFFIIHSGPRVGLNSL